MAQISLFRTLKHTCYIAIEEDNVVFSSGGEVALLNPDIGGLALRAAKRHDCSRPTQATPGQPKNVRLRRNRSS
jgi:hypothetical protein